MLEEAVEGRFDLVLTRPVLVELERVLTTRLGFDAEGWQQVEAFLLDIAGDVTVEPGEPAEPVTGDPADDVILACAVEAGADAVVSGDRRHVLPVGEHRGVRLITPQALLAELAGG